MAGRTARLALASAGLGALVVGVLPSTAGADGGVSKEYPNNGCKYAATWSDGALFAGVVYNRSGSDACSAGWVELHYRDAKGGAHVAEASRAWSPATYGSTGVGAGSDTTVDYVCFSAKSRSHGNWSVVRQVGPVTGSCGAP